MSYYKPKHSFSSAVVEDGTLLWLLMVVASIIYCDTMYIFTEGTHLVNYRAELYNAC